MGQLSFGRINESSKSMGGAKLTGLKYIRAYLPGRWMYSWVRVDLITRRKYIIVFPVIAMTQRQLQEYLRSRKR